MMGKVDTEMAAGYPAAIFVSLNTENQWN